MRIAIVRTVPEEFISMDVYANGLVSGLKAIRPSWEIAELTPRVAGRGGSSWSTGLCKYYERFWRYPNAVAKQRPDVFHIIADQYYHLAFWLKGQGIPVVATCHDLVHFIYPENLRSRAYFPSVAMSALQFSFQGLREVDHVVADSSNTARDVVEKLNIEPKDITIVPIGVDSQFLQRPSAEVEFLRKQYGISNETICILNAGTVEKRKNIITVLRVIERLKVRGLAIHLWKTGEDFTDEQKEYIRSHNLENFITYLGKLDRHTLVQVYNAADLLLSPSLYEGYGMTILEAMACGTPVITSNVSSLPEVAGDASILVEPTNLQAIEEAVVRIRKDPIFCNGLIERGLERAKSFTWEAVAKQISLVYEKVVK